MPDPEVTRFVLAELPAAPARVLEIGAGDGSLAHELRAHGYEVLAIDPAGGAAVEQVGLLDVPAADASFDAAVAVVSLHHVEPLAASFERLAEVVRPGGVLVVDEFDVERLDERAAAWWLGRRNEDHGHDPSPAELVAEMRHHIHPVANVRAELEPWFALSVPMPGPYLYRWHMPDGHRPEEEDAIAAGDIPSTGVRFTATRHS